MRQRATSFYGKIVIYSFFLSLFVHVLLLLIKMTSDLSENTQTVKKEEKRIRLIVKKNPHKKQIVTTEKAKEKKSQDNAFLGEFNQSFERQTIAQKTAPFKEAGMGSKSTLSPPPQNPSLSQKQNSSKQSKNSGKQLNFQDLAISHNHMNEIRSIPKNTARKGIKNGNPQKIGLAQNNDYIEDVPLGDVTNLNTVEYKYYGFFNRIKKKLEQHWGKSLRQKARIMYQKGRRIPANSLRITSLMIQLDSNGNVINVIIKGSSGVQEFDDAALESFNKAGPFPNPPKSMIKNGAAHIEWGFIVKG